MLIVDACNVAFRLALAGSGSSRITSNAVAAATPSASPVARTAPLNHLLQQKTCKLTISHDDYQSGHIRMTLFTLGTQQLLSTLFSCRPLANASCSCCTAPRSPSCAGSSSSIYSCAAQPVSSRPPHHQQQARSLCQTPSSPSPRYPTAQS